ncbi:MAG: SUF system Fe-S cluster assembly protein [Maricaulaceae bacterium]|jgi:FeS assembly SUF system protein
MTDETMKSPEPGSGGGESPSRDVLDVSGKPSPAATPEGAPTKKELARMTDALVAAFKSVYDPEIPVDIYELGLIYRVDVSDDRVVTVDMTLTAPGCPVAGEMPGWVEEAVRKVEGVRDVTVNMVFDPPWDMSRMSDEARLELNML